MLFIIISIPMLNLGLAIVSLLVLLKAANEFVNQSASLAKKFKISGFLIGFTIMAFGTSLPEFITSTYSSVINHPNLAIASVIGSNIANVCLILGIIAIYREFKLSSQDAHFNIPINLIGLILFITLLILSRWQLTALTGSIALLSFPVFIWLANGNNHAIRINGKTKFNLVWLTFSFILLVLTGKLCIDYLLAFAQEYRISDSVVGYFLLSIGTSLPELITSFMAVRKGNNELGIGNILGSNLFNLLFILGINSLVIDLNFQLFTREIFYLLLATSSIFIFALLGKKYYFSKKEGFGLICIYLGFVLLQNPHWLRQLW